MTEKQTRRRRAVLVPLLAVGVAAWAVRSRLTERRTLHDSWQELPPRPVPAAAPVLAAAPAPVDEPAEPDAQRELMVSGPVVEPVSAPQPVLPRARAVPAATAVASVTAPALPDTPFGPGSVRASADGSSPDADHVVKGKSATRVFYAPGSPYYARTRADVWFRTADDARAAGFTPRAPRRS
jgi:hypothetical protein